MRRCYRHAADRPAGRVATLRTTTTISALIRSLRAHILLRRPHVVVRVGDARPVAAAAPARSRRGEPPRDPSSATCSDR
jgi:hypothetical protein